MPEFVAWQYTEHFIDNDSRYPDGILEQELNGLGLDGWQVVSVDWDAVQKGEEGVRVLLQRPVMGKP